MPRRIIDGYIFKSICGIPCEVLDPYVKLVMFSHQSIVKKMPIDLLRVSQCCRPGDIHVLAA